MESVFKYLEKEWDGGWEPIANDYVVDRFQAKVMLVGRGKENKAVVIVTVENYLVITEEGRMKPDIVFRLEMAKCRVGEQGTAVELTEVSSGIFSSPLKVILRFESSDEALKFKQLINGCI